MKKLLFALCMVFGTAVLVNAQDTASTASPTDPTSTTQSTTTTTTTSQDNNLEKIKSQDLPSEVKKSLESQDFRGWLVSSAYRMKSTATGSSADAQSGAQGKDVYVVELKNGAQTKTVRFDKDGKKLDDQGMGTDQDQK